MCDVIMGESKVIVEVIVSNRRSYHDNYFDTNTSIAD